MQSWLPIIGAILSLCHISPAGAFPPLHGLKLSSEVVPASCSPLNQNSLTKQLCGLQFLQFYTNQAFPCQIPPLMSQPQPTCRSHIADWQLLSSVHVPSPAHLKNHPRAPLKFPKYMPEFDASFMLRQTAQFRLHHSYPGLQSWAPRAGQWSVERTGVAVGSVSPLASCNSNSWGGKQELT